MTCLPTMAATLSVQTIVQFSHLSPPFSRYSDASRKISSPVVFSGKTLQNKVFSDCVSIHKTHTGNQLSISTNISRLIKLQRKFISDADLVQSHTFDVCRCLGIVSERGTLAIYVATSGPSILFTMALETGSINYSTALGDFFYLATRHTN